MLQIIAKQQHLLARLLHHKLVKQARLRRQAGNELQIRLAPLGEMCMGGQWRRQLKAHGTGGKAMLLQQRRDDLLHRVVLKQTAGAALGQQAQARPDGKAVAGLLHIAVLTPGLAHHAMPHALQSGVGGWTGQAGKGRQRVEGWRADGEADRLVDEAGERQGGVGAGDGDVEQVGGVECFVEGEVVYGEVQAQVGGEAQLVGVGHG